MLVAGNCDGCRLAWNWTREIGIDSNIEAHAEGTAQAGAGAASEPRRGVGQGKQ